MTDKLYNFAYGSNTLRNRIEDRVGKVKFIQTFTLPDYILAFNCGGKNLSFANLRPSIGGSVEGVLWELNNSQVVVLDKCEVVPWNYEKHYFLHEGKICYTYISVCKEFKSTALPSPEYFRILQLGAMENNLSQNLEYLTRYKARYLTSSHYEDLEWYDKWLLEEVSRGHDII